MTESEDIKKAVKEALQERTLDDLGNKMTALSKDMAAGFAAVHTRQDSANGKLNKHEADITAMKSTSTGTSAYTSLVLNLGWFLITTLVGTVMYLISKT